MKNLAFTDFKSWFGLFEARTGLRGFKLTNDLDSLNLLHERFVYSIPFDMLDAYYSQSKTLNIPDVLHKILLSHRGGGCSEVNEVFFLVLFHLGFQAYRVMT